MSTITPNISNAIMSLRPGVEWSMDNDDVENITWITPDVEPLTTAEVTAEVGRLQALANEQAAIDANTRAAAIAHAKSLGFTDEMIAIMYPNLVNP